MERENMMMRHLICCLAVLTFVSTVCARDFRRPGHSSRYYRGVVYEYAPIRYNCPTWYAGYDTVVARKIPGVALSPEYPADRIVR